MLFLGLISFLVAIPLFSYSITPLLFTRLTSLLLLYSALLSFNGLYVESIGSGVGIYSGLFHVTQISLGMEGFLLCVGALLLLSWAPSSSSYFNESKDSPKMTNFAPPKGTQVSSSTRYNSLNTPVSFGRRAHSSEGDSASTFSFYPEINEYSLLIVFTTIGACFLLSCSDLVSMYLSIELQSFAVYILATLYRNSESATSAGLKYFLLGGLSSALILLGTAIIYSSTGTTQFESIYHLCATTSASADAFHNTVGMADHTASYSTFGLVVGLQSVFVGMVLIGVGLLFKVASAPFHNWAPDVYDGVPTVVTSWLTTMPKISLFLFLLELQNGFGFTDQITSSLLNSGFEGWSASASEEVNTANWEIASVASWKNLLLLASLLSLVIGTVVGLAQYKIKRLLAYSTISHVGFLLLALALITEDSIEAFLFYLLQYSLTNVATFFILLAFGYTLRKEISFTKDLAGQFQTNPLLSLSLAVCLFSMAGIPPLLGFFAKQMVLYSSVHQGYYFLSVVAVVVSVISASYYLRIVQVLYFESATVDSYPSKGSNDTFGSFGGEVKNKNNSDNKVSISSIHSFLIASLTMMLTFYLIYPTFLVNSSHLLALSYFHY